MLRNVLAPLAAALLVAVSLAPAGDVVLYDPNYPVIKASAIDQPILNVILAGTGDMNTAIGGVPEPVVLNAFVDTGASSSMISYLQATGLYDVPSLGFTAADYIGVYTETGIGGQELGNVTRPLNLFVLNGNSSSVYEANLEDFAAYGAHHLWVRQAEGIGESVDILGLFQIVDPVNLVGMPVIRQRVMEMDFTPLKNVDFSSALGGLDLFSGDANESLDDLDVSSLTGLSGMVTRLLPPGSTELHATNITLDLYLKDFVGSAPPGEVLPTHSQNPVVRHVSLGCDGNGAMLTVTENEWLFDTGAGSTFVSFRRAQELGLVPAEDGNLAEFMADYSGPSLPIGGIGASVNVPILRVDEVRIAAKEGFDLVWQNVDVLILDIPSDPSDPNSASLDGVFGMNLLVPSATINVTVDPAMMNLEDADDLDGILEMLGDLEGLLAGLMDLSPGYFDYALFDATDPDNVELRLWSDAVPEPATLALLALGGLALLRRRASRRVPGRG